MAPRAPLLFLLLNVLGAFSSPLDPHSINSTGCGVSKFCLMRPRGCSPLRDCTQAYILSVVGDNSLKVEMAAQALVPTENLQYMSIGFSTDRIMGDDVVSECVVSERGLDGGGEVFLSRNNEDKTNDRSFIDKVEADFIFSQLKTFHVDGRIACSFVLSIRPQLASSHGGRIINLDKPFYIFGATGSAQPDEINVHDLNKESFFFPLTSDTMVNPSQIGHPSFTLPPPQLSLSDPNKSPPPTVKPSPRRGSSVVAYFSPLLLSLYFFL